MAEQVLKENTPRWITSVKLTRLTMGETVGCSSIASHDQTVYGM